MILSATRNRCGVDPIHRTRLVQDKNLHANLDVRKDVKEPIMRINFRSPGLWVFLLAISLAVFSNLASKRGYITESTSWAVEKSAPTTTAVNMREGAVLPESVGSFKIVGERIQFVESETGRSFKCLENLMLQRIYQTIADNPSPATWIITGKITEYRGDNFLIVEMLRRTK